VFVSFRASFEFVTETLLSRSSVVTKAKIPTLLLRVCRPGSDARGRTTETPEGGNRSSREFLPRAVICGLASRPNIEATAYCMLVDYSPPNRNTTPAEYRISFWWSPNPLVEPPRLALSN